MDPKTIIFIGKSGSGKGTQARKLVTALEEQNKNTKVILLPSGTLLRNFIETGTYTANRLKEVLDEGGLSEVFIPISAWAKCLDANITDNTEHIVFEGVARLVDESKVLNGAFAFYGRERVDVVVLDLSDEVATERLKRRGRYDDTDEEIQTRLVWYEENTTKSIEYFKDTERYRVHTIDASKDPDAVFKDILKAVVE